jgi:hypothetical protein
LAMSGFFSPLIRAAASSQTPPRTASPIWALVGRDCLCWPRAYEAVA